MTYYYDLKGKEYSAKEITGENFIYWDCLP